MELLLVQQPDWQSPNWFQLFAVAGSKRYTEFCVYTILNYYPFLHHNNDNLQLIFSIACYIIILRWKPPVTATT